MRDIDTYDSTVNQLYEACKAHQPISFDMPANHDHAELHIDHAEIEVLDVTNGVLQVAGQVLCYVGVCNLQLHSR